jgi:hypothetical protein
MFSLFLWVCGRVCGGVVGWSRRVVVLHLVGAEGSGWSFWSAVFVWQRKKGKKEISNLDVVMSYCRAITANNPMRSEGR